MHRVVLTQQCEHLHALIWSPFPRSSRVNRRDFTMTLRPPLVGLPVACRSEPKPLIRVCTRANSRVVYQLL